VKVALGLGSSLGPRRRQLERAVCALDAHLQVEVLRVSRWLRTPPMRGGTARGWFLNGVALVETTLSPVELLGVCQQLEARAGRRRARHWGDRTLDLDLLVADGVISDEPRLQLPHPGIFSRTFVYAPLLEVWPDAPDGVGGLLRDHAAPSVPRPSLWPHLD